MPADQHPDHKHDRSHERRPARIRPVTLPTDAEHLSAELRILAEDWTSLTGHLLSSGEEQSALLTCGIAETHSKSGTALTFLVRDLKLLGEDDYLDRGAMHLSVAPTTLARHAKSARQADAAVVLVHSHPFPGQVTASWIDLATETDLCGRVLTARTGRPSAALVIGPNGVDARAWTTMGAVALNTVHVLGDQVTRISATSSGLPSAPAPSISRPVAPDTPKESESGSTLHSGATARQELLWGSAGQQVLADSHVVVVGGGGTGSHVITQLAHLRVGRLTLIDDDVVEDTNLSRVLGTTPAAVGAAKVEALTAHARAIHPGIVADPIRGSILDVDPASYLGADVIVCATDGHGSRSLLTEVSTQYLIPVVDLGVEVVTDKHSDEEDDENSCNQVTGRPARFRAGGGVRILHPGRGCLWCAGTLDPERVRREYLDEDQRALEIARGYIRGVDEPAPSVVALNGVVASLAVLEICQLLVGMLGSGSDRLLYRAERRALSTARIVKRSTCHICGGNGMLARGDAVPLKTRWRDNPDVPGSRRLG